MKNNKMQTFCQCLTALCVEKVWGFECRGKPRQDWHSADHTHGATALRLLAGLGRRWLRVPQHHRNFTVFSSFLWVLLGAPDFLMAKFPTFIQYKPYAKNYCAVRKETFYNMEGWNSCFLVC